MFASVSLGNLPGLPQLFLASSAPFSLDRPDWTGDEGQVLEFFTPGGVAIVAQVSENAAPALRRKVAAAVARLVARLKLAGLEISADAEFLAGALGEAFELLSWSAAAMKGSASKPQNLVAVTLSAGSADGRAALARGLGLAASANVARTLVNTPPNVATPLAIAAQAREMAKELGLECRVIEGEELLAERMTGLIEVGKASENAPCLIRLAWNPAGSEGKAPVVLLGKTITYDTGGLSLKVNNGMKGMKGDKAGGCAVLGAMHAIATVLKPDFPVVGLLVAAENSVSNNAYRPDDVITYRNGVTVEVTNTDAEGRLVLADGLVWACEVEKARQIIDLATLTGGVVTALGKIYAGYFCDDADLMGGLEAAGEATGEKVWRLPLNQEYRDMMKSEIADLINSNPNRLAHPVQGAAFLAAFVEPGTPWAHIDIAGAASADKDLDAYVAGPNGFGVRLLAEYLTQLA